MTALILIDQAHRDTDDVSRAASFLMNTRNRVRFVDVVHLAATDFTDVRYFVIACDDHTFGQSVNDAIHRSTAQGMQTLSLMDIDRMRNFRDQRVN